MKVILIGVVLFVFAGCEIIGPDEGDVLGTVTSTRVILSNRKGTPVYYFVVGRATAARISWAPGISEENEIPPGKSVNLQKRDIFKARSEEEVIVYWWQAQWVDRELKAGEIQHFVLHL